MLEKSTSLKPEFLTTSTKAVPMKGNKNLPVYLKPELCRKWSPISNSYLYYYFSFNQEFKYWLRGRLGEETVTIVDGKLERNVTLKGKSQLFTAKRNNISVKFTNDKGSRDVFFDSDISTSITAPYLFGMWGCGLNANEDKDSRCEGVRNGEFAWGGTYIVIFKGTEFSVTQIDAITMKIICIIYP